MDHLVELCREGRVSGVGLGATPGQARALLGEPYDESVAREPYVLVYGAVELTFSGGELEMITLGFGTSLHDLPPSLAAGVPRKWADLPREIALATLRAHGVELARYPHPDARTYDYRATTVRGDIVNVTFDDHGLAGVVCARGDRTAPRVLVMPAPMRRA